MMSRCKEDLCIELVPYVRVYIDYENVFDRPTLDQSSIPPYRGDNGLVVIV